ncbi:hypothetical protein J8TS2_28590 [Lederbergia ruris]|uniref:YhfM-like domain-containing protein n=1 Tax=Lederbergia ruris TaxID=217495 RepID=A0ABQ4KKQ2_9BACI|nr:hypothetical protein [Lederbergia ruris]GIN58540.1 hypothetical protein J8TS2_28590 [Lederbergia ruris]
MRIIIMLVLSLTFMTATLLGCNNGIADGKIAKVSISKSSGFGKVNTDFYAEFEDEGILDLFKNVISNAVKEEGIVNMIEPEFDLEVGCADGSNHGYHLWLGEKEQISTLMNIDDTHTIYTISEEMTNKLIDIVQ